MTARKNPSNSMKGGFRKKSNLMLLVYWCIGVLEKGSVDSEATFSRSHGLTVSPSHLPTGREAPISPSYATKELG